MLNAPQVTVKSFNEQQQTKKRKKGKWSGSRTVIKMNEKAANGQTLKDLQKAWPDQRIISLAHWKKK